MSETLIGRRGLLTLALSLALVPAAISADAIARDLPRQDPKSCKGQPELKPLQPLEIVTGKGRAKFLVEYAGTDMQREYGLMCRRALAADRGMLFDFHQPQQYSAFWMRNTLIPLDIIYIRPDGRVLSIARNARPLDETPIPANGTILGVLEIASGRAEQLGILPGDKVVHRMFPA